MRGPSKPDRPICGAKMMPSKQLGLGKHQRRVLGLSRIVCTLDPGHKENHFCKTKTATYQWWNEDDNPQRPA